MEETNMIVRPIISKMVKELEDKQFASAEELYSFLEKEIISNFGPLAARSEKLLNEIKEELFNPDLLSKFKYPVIMYASLLFAQNDNTFSLLSFYYEFTSKALKDLKKGGKENNPFWETLFQKIYQFGILLLTGNRTLLLTMANLATRVNSQILAQRARQTKINKLIRIYNCILNIPEEYLSLKQIMSLTLIFTRWEASEDDPFSASFFASFQKKTQKKLIKKISRYPRSNFTQQLLLSLVNIVLCGEDLLFSYFLEAKFLYESSKTQSSNCKEKPALEGLRKAHIIPEGKRLFNLIIQLLLEAPQDTLRSLERESIIYMALKTLSGKFQNNQELFEILALRYIAERNEIICQILYRLVREEALTYLTVYKLKLLLNIFNRTSWKHILNQHITENILIDRLAKIIQLLTALARRYSDQDLNLRCLPTRCGLTIQNVREVKSLAFVVVFERVGRIAEPQNLEYCLLKIKLDKAEYEVFVSFLDNSEILSVELKRESRERAAFIIIKKENRVILQQKKQYLRFGQGNFESLVTATLKGKECKSLQISIDGAFYELELGRKSQIKGFELGYCFGAIRSFYALNCQLEVIEFHKKWCERERKIRSVVQELGFDKYCYKINHHQQPAILQFQQQKWSIFHSKTEISIIESFKHPKMLDIYLQLGGLETFFFVLERLSRCLEELQGNSQKIVQLFRSFFQMLRLTALMDGSYLFLDDILRNFKLINPFLFLLIKRNHFVRETNDSRLLLSIFELIVYFRKQKQTKMLKAEIEKKMKKIEMKLVINTLSNFEIWSNCSSPLQQFVITLIDSYVKEGNQIEELIKKDLHQEILSSIILFVTSESQFTFSQHLQKSLAEICLTLYSTILKSYDSISSIKELNLKKIGGQNQSFVERDLNHTLCLLRSLSHRSLSRALSQSQNSAFHILIRYLKKCFLGSDILFKIIGKNWSKVISVLCSIASSEMNLGPDLICHLSEVILNYVSRELSFDWWILNFVNSYIDNSKSQFKDCMRVVSHVADKYNFMTAGKTAVLQRIVQKMIQKSTKMEKEQKLNMVGDLKTLFYQISSKGLYRLGCHKTYINFMQLLKNMYFADQNQELWRQICRYLLEILFKNVCINQNNSPFVDFLLKNIYDKDSRHPLAAINSHASREHIALVKEMAKFPITTSAETLGSECYAGAYALIQNCRGWPTLYYLLEHGLLVSNGDVSLPFVQTDLKAKECPGGIIAYYLSGPCEPLQLYLLLNIIIYRQLGNRITFLSTLAPTAIYQKTIENLLKMSTKDEFKETCHLIVILLKEIVTSLNSGYLIKAGAVWKDAEKILGSPGADKNKKKNINLIEVLVKASKTVEMALEDSKIDKDLLAFKELIINKLKIINEEKQIDEMKILIDLADEIKKYGELLLHKLAVIGSRFFEVSREHWRTRNVGNCMAEPVSEKLIELLFDQNQKIQEYEEQLNQRYQNVLYYFNDRGVYGEKEWKKLLISNEHWFELQGALDDLTTKFYEMDQKNIGPFGFYKLNIKPLKTDLDKLPYPRRKQYKELIMQKEREQKVRELSLTVKLTVEKETSTFFSSFAESSREDLLRSVPKELQMDPPKGHNQKHSRQEYWCEWVTKRGVYAGKISKKNKDILFTFTNHSQLPSDLVYRISTNKCHWIQSLNQWEQEEINNAAIPFPRSEIFTRRYILRHTALQIFSEKNHISYFFNLFHQDAVMRFLEEFRGEEVDLIIDRKEEFAKRKFTERWKKGELNNFQYLCLVNRYSGRTTNDLAQYPVMPWVIVNFDGKDNYTEINKDFMKNEKNLRDLTIPTGKLNPQKFKKLKMRLNEIDPSDVEIRFLYGTMFSNPTILYNFFIRLEPFTSLHWEHQGRKLDHADRLFSGINEQFATVISSSSDNKELSPEFYYWPEFLRNRNQIELGRKQKGEEVHSVVLPVWAHTPEEFVFKMREVLESQQVSQKLHHWIDLVFGYKSFYEVAEEYDNIYHYQCYEHDIFTAYENENEIKTAQIAISEFGQVPEALFFKEHPKRQIRKHIDIDQGVCIFKPQKDFLPISFELNDAGIILWSEKQILFKKASIPGLYSNFEWARQFEHRGNCYLLSVNLNTWISLSGGVARFHEKKKVKWEHLLDSKCLEAMKEYIFYGLGSKIEIIKFVGDHFETVKSLYAHHSEVILIHTEPILDLILSVDKSGLVLIHELTELRFFRAFKLGVDFSGADVSKLKVCVHLMGYFIFLDHEQTIYVYNFLGELMLQQELQVRLSDHRGDQQLITDIQLMNHEEPLILVSSSMGNIYVLNFLQIIRFKEIYPFKNYSRMNHNLLASVKKRSSNSIVKFSMVHSRATSNIIYQLVVLYSDGEVVCFSENTEMGKQLQSIDRLKSMGFV